MLRSYYAFASASICIYRCTPSTSSSAIPCTIASARVSTLTVLSTNGTPTALAILKIGMTGRTSSYTGRRNGKHEK